MTEAEWKVSDDAGRMLALLDRKVSTRKLRLLACAVVRNAAFAEDSRSMWQQAPEFDWFMQWAWRYTVDSNTEVVQTQELMQMNCREAIEVIERSVDTPGLETQVATAAFATFAARYHAEAGTSDYIPNPKPGARHEERIACFFEAIVKDPNNFERQLAYWEQHYSEPWLRTSTLPAVANLLSDIFGNPFRPVTLNPNWRTSDVVAMCRGMYETRDFAAMPILADALQDAGCENDDILNHCRGSGPHVRGCWVVDLLLGKE